MTSDNVLQIEEVLKSLFESPSVMVGLVEMDRDTLRYLTASPAASAVLFRHSESSQMHGRSFSELGFDAASIRRWLDSCREAERLGRPVRFEYFHPVGTDSKFLVVSVTFISGTENHSFFSYVATDNTELQRATEQLSEIRETLEQRIRERTHDLQQSRTRLQENEWFLEKAQEIAELGSWISSASQEGSLQWSKEVYRIFGLSEQAHDFDGRVETFFGLVHPLDRDRVIQASQRAILEQMPYDLEHRILRPDGSVRWVHEVAKVLRDEQGHPVRMIGVVQDITARKAAEETLRKTEEELRRSLSIRNDFLSIASHELKTPVTSLKLQLDFLTRLGQREGYEKVVPTLLERLIRIAARQIARLDQLVNDMLEISKLGSAPLVLARQPVNLAKLVLEVMERFSTEVKTSGSTVSIRAEPDVNGQWDAFRLEQAISNLVSNAIKYGQGKEIIIEVRKESEKGMLKIRDHGIGIPEERQAAIFDLFERAIPPTSISGLGIGLFIVRTIIGAHGGRVHVKSKPGAGSTFTVELPVSQKQVSNYAA
ncbi:MAG TPA: HAMP domain-containing sensor histidine kinase [Bdellovibrionota bacterium]|nr:HAMP domain-containing sensor histidine kinase [Bdellovibrionota bacterium]